MTDPRAAPYCWVTWITKLVVGEAHCVWSAWLRANFKYEKLPRTFDFADWNVKHTALVSRRAAELRADGWEIRLEDQNAFKLRGKNGVTLAGKPDIIAVRPDRILIVDAKTGKTRDSDHAQVQTYMAVVNACWPEWRGRDLAGEVCYPDRQIPVETPSIAFRGQLRRTMDILADAVGPRQTPSRSECNWCDIARCPARFSEGEYAGATGGNPADAPF